MDEYRADLILQREIAAADVLISPVMTQEYRFDGFLILY
jgi:hypothetical protein